MTARFRGRPDGNVKRYSWFSIGGLSVAKKEVNGSSCGSRIGLSLHVPIVYLGRGSWSSKWKNIVENGVWSFSRDGQNDLRHLLYVSRRPNGDMIGANKAKEARDATQKEATCAYAWVAAAASVKLSVFVWLLGRGRARDACDGIIVITVHSGLILSLIIIYCWSPCRTTYHACCSSYTTVKKTSFGTPIPPCPRPPSNSTASGDPSHYITAGILHKLDDMGPLSPLKGQVAISQTENWDDDFEFSLSPPKDYNKSTATLKENKYQTIYDKNRDTPSLVRPKSLSLSPTKPSHSDAPSCPKVPAPLHTPCPQSPRHSPSYPSDLTSLSSKSKPSLSNLDPVSPPLLSTRPNPSIPQRRGQGFRSRARSTTAINGYVTPKKLTKRHPSASFVPIRSSHSSRSLRQNDSTASLSCSLHRCATCPDAMYPCTPPSTTDIPGSASGEPMSPLLLSEKVASGVADLLRKRSRTKSRPRMPPLPFSDNTAGKEHGKRLWNRFSGNPSSNKGMISFESIPRLMMCL